MELTFESLTTTEAALAAGVSVSQINRVFDEEILPHHLYSQSATRSIRSDACLLIAFYLKTADVLTKPARLHAMKDALTACKTWAEWERCVVEESGISVRFLRILEVGFGQIESASRGACVGRRRPRGSEGNSGNKGHSHPRLRCGRSGRSRKSDLGNIGDLSAPRSREDLTCFRVCEGCPREGPPEAP